MRLLFMAGPLYGHINTMLPLARAALHAGHEVVMATGPDMARYVAGHGLQSWAAGLTHAQAGGSRPSSWIDYFATAAQMRVAELLPRAQAWQPDVVVHEETELAGAVVARRTGARRVVHGLGLMPSVRTWSAFVPAFESLGRQWQMPDLMASLARSTYLHVCPPGLQPAGERFWPHVLRLRPSAGLPLPDEQLPAAMAALPFAQTIHLTLGTVFHEGVALLHRAIEGLRTLPFNLVVTVGPNADVAAFGAQPAHVLLANYVPHTLLLPRCRLVVSQGGAGILLGGLAHGLPQLLLPQGADQFGNAAACRDAGAALTLIGEGITAQEIHATARRLLDEPQFTHAARHLQAEIAAMPDATQVLRQLTTCAQPPLSL